MPARRKLRLATVRSVRNITPNMRRIVLGGADFADFPTGREGGYIKLAFPDAPHATPDDPAMRTYSVRAHDPASCEITVDFALHGDAGGLATDWALTVAPGDQIALGGPGSVKMVDSTADWILLAADMTGLPALACNVEQLPRDAIGYVVVEITSEADKQPFDLPDGVALHWVINPHPETDKDKLLSQIRALAWRAGRPFVWTACEFDTMRALRSYYRTDRQIGRNEFYLSSYWRAGRTEDQHKVDKAKDNADTVPATT
ncbi:siderophore-interacting protein [Shimia abyssi]|uniref:NADPH-dependent ferric siderophore reductase n=1 Tax=Shimia abyssi TaxID=1662395 RepID=A0A2P8FJ23_9RHOB|nr:siderophore-interacting protein [Shimia abyssi]PSL21693.1 NADPH-dependent ferric siderophore reductase [Shimia abyssi]